MKIGLLGIQVFCVIGVYAKERKKPRKLLIDIEVDPIVKLEKSGLSDAEKDSLETTINYEEIAALCQNIAVEGQFKLIETLATAILERCLETFPVTRARVCVKKSSALDNVSMAYVELTRERT